MKYLFYLLLIGFTLLSAKSDMKGSFEHPFMNRFPHHYIKYQTTRTYDEIELPVAKHKRKIFHGYYYHTRYEAESKKDDISYAQLVKNLQHAAKKSEGSVIYQDPIQKDILLSFTYKGKKLYLYAKKPFSGYRITIIEEKEAPQYISFNKDAPFTQSKKPLKVDFSKDQKGSRDHPLINRIPGHLIGYQSIKEFDSYKLPIAHNEYKKVEGKITDTYYRIFPHIKPYSKTHIIHNVINAVTSAGGKLLYKDSKNKHASLSIEVQGKQLYIDVEPKSDAYRLHIIETSAMKQYLQIDEKSLKQQILNKGSASVYGILFDFNKASIKQESHKTLKIIASLLKNSPKMRFYVVGHTDMKGNFKYNQDLSLKRARSVVKSLISQYGIKPSRLIPHGVGSLAPVASNTSKEGQMLNRRVTFVLIP